MPDPIAVDASEEEEEEKEEGLLWRGKRNSKHSFWEGTHTPALMWLCGVFLSA